MNEDEILERSITYYSHQGLTLLYRTRPIADGAIGGVDAILHKPEPLKFVFIDAKGGGVDSIRRSTDFNNVVGAMVKRIRFEKGYSGVEDTKRFNPLGNKTPKEVREMIKNHAVYRHSEYVLALAPEMKETIRFGLDPTLMSLLKIHILIVHPDTFEFYVWRQ